MIEIDGSLGEGGGQILRTSLALSMCTGQAFRLTRIRAGRPRPGLMRQHLTCVNAATEICGAAIQGGVLQSQSLSFTPGPVRAGDYDFNVGSAGSCTLVLQTVWPALMLAEAPSRLKLGGGTHNPMAPPFHFLARSYAPLLRRLGADVELVLHRSGFYPAGGGEMEATIHPAGDSLRPFDLSARGALLKSYAECLAPAIPRSVARRELGLVGEGLGWTEDQLSELACRENEGPGNALMATVVHEHVNEVFSAFGGRGIRAEQVAREVVRAVKAYQAGDAALGPQLADQWILPLALAVWQRRVPASYSCTALTAHARTNFEVIERFLPVKITSERLGQGWTVSVRAIQADAG